MGKWPVNVFPDTSYSGLHNSRLLSTEMGGSSQVFVSNIIGSSIA